MDGCVPQPLLTSAQLTTTPKTTTVSNCGYNSTVNCPLQRMTVTMPKPRARWRMNKIFFEDEVEHTTPVKKNKKMVDVILSKLVVDSTGAAPGSMDAMDATTIRLMGGCRGTCKNQCVDLQTCFTPTESMNNVRSRQFFLEGVQGFKDAVQCGDADKARRWRQ